MNVIVIQGTSLSPSKAHWVQILNTAWAIAKLGRGEVWVVPRTYELGMPEKILGEMGLDALPNLHFLPSVTHSTYKRLKMRGDMFTPVQSKLGRFLARKTFAKLLKELSKNDKSLLVLTRNQYIPSLCGDLLKNHDSVSLNEHHKFEYVKDLEGKLQKKRPGRRTLSQFKLFASQERIAEIERLRKFDGVICTTESIRERLNEFGFDQPSVVIPNGANISWAEGESTQKDIDILYVGQLYRWKNVDLLIDSLQHLKEKKLTIVGGDQEDDFERLKGLAGKIGVANRVEFLGHRPHGEIKQYMQRAHVGVVPLPRRGFPEARMFCCPLKALEMMAAGTPIVATRLRSVESVLRHEENCVLVEPDNAQALASGIEQVLKNEELRTKIILGGHKTAADLSYSSRAEKIFSFAAACRTVSHV